MKNRFSIVVSYEAPCRCNSGIRFGANVNAKGQMVYFLECANCGASVEQPIMETVMTSLLRHEPGPMAFLLPTQAKAKA